MIRRLSTVQTYRGRVRIGDRWIKSLGREVFIVDNQRMYRKDVKGYGCVRLCRRMYTGKFVFHRMPYDMWQNTRNEKGELLVKCKRVSLAGTRKNVDESTTYMV